MKYRPSRAMSHFHPASVSLRQIQGVSTLTPIFAAKFDAPSSVSTTPTAVNAKGTVTGYYLDNVNYWQHAFIRTRDGTFTTFDAPGPNAVPPTLALAINADGVVAGWGWPDGGKGEAEGFARDRNGRVHAIRLPNTDITPQGINNEGVVVGTLGQGDKYYGFIWTP
jgi:hypothetical protein